MAGKVSITDFVLALGFDGKEVDKGIAGLERKLKKLPSASGSPRQARKVESKKRKEMREELRLKRAKLLLEKELNKTQALGARRNHHHMKAMNKDFKDLLKIQQYTETLRAKNYRMDRAAKTAAAMAPAQPTAKAPRVRPNREEERAKRRHIRGLERKVQADRAALRESMKLQKSFRGLNGAMAKVALFAGTLTGIGSLAAGIHQAVLGEMNTERAQVGIKGVGQALTMMNPDGSGTVRSTNQDTLSFYKEQKMFLKDLVKTYAIDLPAATDTWRAVLGASIGQINNGKLAVSDLKDLMQGVSAGAAAFKMNTEDQKLMWLGITQAMQKGKVQAEEITRQIGQRNPLAIEALVRATGNWAKETGKVSEASEVTHEQMYKMMREGQLLSKDIMPRWGREMKAISDLMTDGDYVGYMASSLGGALQVYKSNMSLFWNDIFTEDAFTPMKNVMNTLASIVAQSDWFSDQAGAYIGNVFGEVGLVLKELAKLNKKKNQEYGKDVLSDTEAIVARSKEIAAEVKAVFTRLKNFFSGFFEGASDAYDIVKQIFNAFMDIYNFVRDGLGLDKSETSLASMLGYAIGFGAVLKGIGGLAVFGKISTMAANAASLAMTTKRLKDATMVGGAVSGAAGAAGAGITAGTIATFASGVAVFAASTALIKSMFDGDGGKSIAEMLGFDLPDWMYDTENGFKTLLNINANPDGTLRKSAEQLRASREQAYNNVMSKTMPLNLTVKGEFSVENGNITPHVEDVIERKENEWNEVGG